MEGVAAVIIDFPTISDPSVATHLKKVNFAEYALGTSGISEK